MINYVKTAFTKPKEIYTGRNMKNAHFFSLALLLTFAVTLLSLFEFLPIGQNIINDFNEVKESIPDFELVDNELESDADSYIYQTDSIILYFDTEDQVNSETINRNMNTTSVPLSVGLLQDEIYLNMMGQDYSIQYSALEHFTTGDLKSMIDSVGDLSPGMIIFFVIFLFIFNLFLFVFQFFPLALFANLISIYRRTALRFGQSAKIALLATILPTLIVHLISAVIYPISFQFEVIFGASLVFYYMSITEMKKRMEKQNNHDHDEE